MYPNKLKKKKRGRTDKDSEIQEERKIKEKKCNERNNKSVVVILWLAWPSFLCVKTICLWTHCGTRY